MPKIVCKESVSVEETIQEAIRQASKTEENIEVTIGKATFVVSPGSNFDRALANYRAALHNADDPPVADGAFAA